MTKLIQVKTPDLGDFENVPIIEIFVSVGDSIAKDDLLLAIESDKATMEIPSSESGLVKEILVQVGDTVSSGMTLVKLETDSSANNQNESDSQDTSPEQIAPQTNSTDTLSDTAHTNDPAQIQSDLPR